MEDFDPAEIEEPMDFLDDYDFLDGSEPAELIDEEFLQQVETSPLKQPHIIRFSGANVNLPPSSSRPSYPTLEQLPAKPVEPNPKEDLEDNVAEEDNEDDLASPVAEAAKPVQVKQRKPYGKKKKKDPNAPSAHISAYALFFKDTQAKVKSQNPGAKFGDISRIVARIWESMPESDKSIFRQRSEQDRVRFLREMAEYKNDQLSSQQPTAVVQPQPAKAAKNVKVVVPSAEVTHLFGSNGSLIENDSIRCTNTWEVTDNVCVKEGCSQNAVKSPEWEDEFCSNECAVMHCKQVFQDFISRDKNASSAICV